MTETPLPTEVTCAWRLINAVKFTETLTRSQILVNISILLFQRTFPDVTNMGKAFINAQNFLFVEVSTLTTNLTKI
jgi:hypothetical protein